MDPNELTAKIAELKKGVEEAVKSIDTAIQAALDIRGAFTEWQSKLALPSAPAASVPEPEKPTAHNGSNGATHNNSNGALTLRERALHFVEGHPGAVIEDIATGLHHENRNSLQTTLSVLKKGKMLKMKKLEGHNTYWPK